MLIVLFLRVVTMVRRICTLILGLTATKKCKSSLPYCTYPSWNWVLLPLTVVCSQGPLCWGSLAQGHILHSPEHPLVPGTLSLVLVGQILDSALLGLMSPAALLCQKAFSAFLSRHLQSSYELQPLYQAYEKKQKNKKWFNKNSMHKLWKQS